MEPHDSSRRDSPEAGASLPRLYAGRRRWLIWRLILNGVARASVAFGMAYLLRTGLAGVRHDALWWPAVAGIAASGVVALALRAIEAADAERLGQDYVMRVRLRIFDRIAARPLQTGHRRWGVTMTRMISDLDSLRNWVSIGVAHAVVASITVCGLLLSLTYFSPHTGPAVTIMVALSLLGVLALTPLLRGYVREARRRRGRLANNLGEKVFAFRTVRHFGRTAQELVRVRAESQRLRDALVRWVRAARILRAVPELMLPITVATVVALTALTRQDVDKVAIAVLMLGMIASALGELARAWNYRLVFEEGRRRIGELLEGPQLREAEAASDLPGRGPVAVVLDGVCVGRELGPLHVGVAAGEVALVAGPSGSGKSTVLALAARLLDPDRGEVRLDGLPLASLRLDSLHEAVQLVAPEVPLLRGSLGDNVCYGLDTNEDEWIAEVITACGLDQETRLLPEGLEARVEEGGQNLPHGLRARVALARAAAVRPRLLLVDDAAFVADPAAGAALGRVVSLLGATTLVVGPEAKPPLPVDRVWRLECRENTAKSKDREEKPLKNFRLVRDKVDVEPILEEVARQEEAWTVQMGRQKIAVQREAEAIPIRGLRKSRIGDRKRRDVHESRYTTLSRSFPSVVAFIEGFADEVGARLGRAKIVRLPPGHRVLPHRDRGEYYARRDRYHLILQSAGSWMRCGEEEVAMREGELWWFDNKEEHEARNDSDRDRVHLIFDLER